MSQVDQQVINNAAEILRQGGLVAFPTETVYGLGANALDGRAVAKIFKAKGRPQFNPLIVHVGSLEAIEALCHVPAVARKLADAFWPGPLTLVLARKSDCPVSELVSAGLPTLAVRIPAHPLARTLLKTADIPICAPSANRSGHVSATQATHVSSDLGLRVDFILDGGKTSHGLESTIVAISEIKTPDIANDTSQNNEVFLLRAGAIKTSTLENLLGYKITKRTNMIGAQAHAPGQLESHYAPATTLRLNASSLHKGEALLAFGPNQPKHDGPCKNLSPTGELEEAAANLFSFLRELDTCKASRIAVMPIPAEGLGEAINDRLNRAAAPRP